MYINGPLQVRNKNTDFFLAFSPLPLQIFPNSVLTLVFFQLPGFLIKFTFVYSFVSTWPVSPIRMPLPTCCLLCPVNAWSFQIKSLIKLCQPWPHLRPFFSAWYSPCTWICVYKHVSCHVGTVYVLFVLPTIKSIPWMDDSATAPTICLKVHK